MLSPLGGDEASCEVDGSTKSSDGENTHDSGLPDEGVTEETPFVDGLQSMQLGTPLWESKQTKSNIIY